jgi:hypothetical protein
MEREFMQSVPDSIMLDHKYIAHDDNIFNLNMNDFILDLENSSEFYHDRTKETMEKVLNQLVKEQIEVLKNDAAWYIKNVMPIFLKGEFNK